MVRSEVTVSSYILLSSGFIRRVNITNPTPSLVHGDSLSSLFITLMSSEYKHTTFRSHKSGPPVDSQVINKQK